MSREQRLHDLLKHTFQNAEFLNVENESNRHHVPADSETHFKITLVSDDFAGLSLIQRQRQINKLVEDEFSKGLHALSMHLFTPQEWQKKQQKTQHSPACRDGYHHG